MEHSISGAGLACEVLKPRSYKLRRITRLTFFFVLFACIEIRASGFSQTVSFSGKGVPLQEVFTSFERQTGFSFFFNYSLLKNAKPVTLEIRNVSLDKALKEVLKDEELDFYQQGKTIFIVKKAIHETAESQLVSEKPSGKLTDVRGRVLNQRGEALGGATVSMKNGSKVTLTNDRGDFELKQVAVGAMLEVTYLGYVRQEVQIAGQDIKIEMVIANNKLDEVQVIAYGQTSERLSTGNTGSVKSEDISKQPVANPLLALEGRVPGLFITQANGIPGGGVSIRIQGQNSIGRGNDPLFVIDGVPYTSQLLPTTFGAASSPLGISGTGFGSNYGNPMSYVNPNDIESITILKDADATAIYGSRAANGAVLITTKKGKAGTTTTADITLQNGWGSVAHKMTELNTKQYLQMRNEAISNDGLTVASTDYDINGTWDTTRYTDWQKALIGRTAMYQNANATLSGGGNNTQYLIGGTFHRETTVFPGDFADQKGAIHFNINNSSNDKKFRMQFSGSYMIDNNKLPQLDLTGEALYLAPDAPPVRKADGTINWAPDSTGTSSFYPQPIAGLYNTYQNKTTNLISSADFSYRLFNGLELRSSFGYTNLQSNEYAPYPFVAVPPDQQAVSYRASYFTNNNINSWSVEPQINYKRAIARGKLEVLVGATLQQNNSNGQQIYGYGYGNDVILQSLLAAPYTGVVSAINSVYKYDAVFGRANYDWRDKYLIDLAWRRDGSSRFGSQNEYHNFGSLGAAWIFSQENIFKRTVPTLSFGKIRGSYGTTGNDQIGDYAFLSQYAPVNTSIPYQSSTSVAPTGLPNPYLEWEETRKLQIGIDLGFFHDRILINSTYVRNRSSNQLLPYALPIFVGFPSVFENFPATVQNTEWEFSMNAIWIKSKNFSWSSSFNLTIPKNKLVSFPNLATSSYASRLVIGQPISLLKAYHFLGVDPATGVYQFADSHGTDTSSPSPVTDNTKIINTLPKYYGGIQNSFTYGGFQLDILLQFVKRIAANNVFGSSMPGVFNINQPVSVLKRWQQPNQMTSIQRYNSDYSLATQYDDAVGSDAGYSDASFIRLKNVSLSYRLPVAWQHRIHLQNARIFVNCQNLWTITKYKGLDPENLSTSSLPPLRVFTGGIEIGL